MVPSPSIVWPLRSSVTLSAPITMPLVGQLIRSVCRVVSVVIVSPQLSCWTAGAAAVCAPSVITPAAATPIKIANRLPISSFPSVAPISGLLGVVASRLASRWGEARCRLTARRLRHGGTGSVHRSVQARSIRAPERVGARGGRPSAGGADLDVVVLRSDLLPLFGRQVAAHQPAGLPPPGGGIDLPADPAPGFGYHEKAGAVRGESPRHRRVFLRVGGRWGQAGPDRLLRGDVPERRRLVRV